jgi:hypothetical protein
MQQGNRGYQNWESATMFAFGVFILLRVVLSSRLPSYIMAGMPHDDAWVVSRALYILKGEWLGPYDQFTLIKGAFSPLLMAFSSWIGVTFGGLNTALYCIACVVFVTGVRPIIKSNFSQIACFAVLLFNPLSYALETGQRVYRNGIGQWQIILIFGCLIAVFLRRHDNWKVLLKWGLVCGLTLGAFFQTREDGGWIYPFVLGVTFVTAVVFLLEEKGPKKKIIIFLLPIAIALILNGATTIKNYNRYGAAVLNDRNGGNYAKVAGDLHAIAPNPDEDRLYASDAYKGRYYNIYVSTMEKAFAASPALSSASRPIRDAIRNWANWEDIKNGEVSTDHMLFALRDGVKGAGYYQSLPDTEAFYGRVHEELNTAFENGTLVKRGFPISPLIKRLQKRDLGRALALMPKAIRDVTEFRGVSSAAIPATGSAAGIKEFSFMSGGDYYTSPGLLIGSGWAFSEDDKIRLSAGLYDKHGTQIAILPFHTGEDVFEGFKFKYKNAKLSRFSFDIDGYNLDSGVMLRFLDQSGNLLWEIPADGSATCGGAGGVFHYCIDSLKSGPSSEEFYARFVKRANRVIGAYQRFTPFLSIFACLAYFFATILLVWEARKKKALKTLPVWLVLTGLASTFMLFLFSMCLITATSFNAMTYLYTAPAYVLLLMFCTISLFWCVDVVVESGKCGGL